MKHKLPILLRMANPLIRWTGYQFIISYVGYWTHDEAGRPLRAQEPCGYRLASRPYWEGLPDDATEMDRLLAKLRSEARR